jgi:hypothetical protein
MPMKNKKLLAFEFSFNLKIILKIVLLARKESSWVWHVHKSGTTGGIIIISLAQKETTEREGFLLYVCFFFLSLIISFFLSFS